MELTTGLKAVWEHFFDAGLAVERRVTGAG